MLIFVTLQGSAGANIKNAKREELDSSNVNANQTCTSGGDNVRPLR